MVEATDRVEIAAQPAVVFAFLADRTNDKIWRSSVIDMRLESGSGRGARYSQQLRGPGGRSISADIEITSLEPDSLIEFRTLTGPVRPMGSYRVSPADGGCSVTMHLEARLAGFKRLLMASAVQKSMRAEVAALAKLKQVLEDRMT
jgi:hypothetical protein